ncbi:MAG: lamin tail domain-containing protein [Bacteroidales bacterium]|nr:lamin tail domain-containing protein [Bacteroidales bacterium]
MKKVILLVLFMPFSAYGQVIENFESGAINNWFQSSESRWKADTEGALSGKYSLHHSYDNPDAGIDRIGMQVKNLHLTEGNTKWTFQIRHGYDPSSSNNWAIFLMSDREPGNMSIDEGTNGYALGVNLTGYDDTLRIVKVKGAVISTIVNCRLNWQTAIGSAESAIIEVERSPDGYWGVSVYRSNRTLLKQAYGTDKEIFSPVWFSVWYKYSSTRDRLLWVDEVKIEGVFYEDTESPFIISSEESGKNSVILVLSEQPVDESLVPENFSLNTIENRGLNVIKRSPLIYEITFANSLINKSLNVLIINRLCDKSGNCSADLSVTFTPVWAETGDVVISEIMADPFPEISLPPKEYLEVTNRTKYSFNLKNWNLSAGDQNYLLAEKVLEPGEILILCLLADVPQFSKFGRVLGLKQFPALTDGGRLLCLSDSTGTLIHGVDYSSEWYEDELKSNGGWSLEMIDIDFPFFAEGNWGASASRKGGTPGSVNSISGNNPDRKFYGVLNVFPEDSASIRINFSEPVFGFDNSSRIIRIEGDEIFDISRTDPLFREFLVNPGTYLKSGKIYQIGISDEIKDFAGNPLEKKTCSFGIAEPSLQGDVLFNELMFNPLQGDADYIELFNNSEKVVDVSRLQIVSVNDEAGDTSQLYPVSMESRCLLPGEYFTITTEKEMIANRYFSSGNEFIYEVGNMPAMNDDKGHLILYNRELDKIDEVFYNEKMHFSLLSDFEGVALEKTAPGLKSEEAVNWHSAAESSGWGTPGAPNSIFSVIPVTTDKIAFSSSRITPDSDGNEDLLIISFNLTGNGNVISVTVFDETGNYIKKVASNLLTAPDAAILWDGTADDGSPVRTGIYIIYITLYNDSGKTQKWKKVCTVLR